MIPVEVDHMEIPNSPDLRVSCFAPDARAAIAHEKMVTGMAAAAAERDHLAEMHDAAIAARVDRWKAGEPTRFAELVPPPWEPRYAPPNTMGLHGSMAGHPLQGSAFYR